MTTHLLDFAITQKLSIEVGIQNKISWNLHFFIFLKEIHIKYSLNLSYWTQCCGTGAGGAYKLFCRATAVIIHFGSGAEIAFFCVFL